MIVFVDLDYTLLDTKRFKEAMVARLAPFGITEEQFTKTYDETVAAIPDQYDYDMRRHARLLSGVSGRDEEELFKALEDSVVHLPECLFPDSIAFLEFLKTLPVRIELVTFGNPKWQEQKTDGLGIRNYFDACIFTETGKHTLSLEGKGNPSEWIFVNDNPKEIVALMERFPGSHMVRIRRENGKPFAPDIDALAVPTFATLEAAEPAIKAIMEG